MECQSKNTYLICSPEFIMYSGSYDPPEPPEYGRSAVILEVDDRNNAKALALKTPEFKRWLDESCGDNPFKGLTIEQLKCPEGFCCCSNCNNFCNDCIEGRE